MKVGEPGFPVAAAERGRRVYSSFEVGDHDFTCLSMVPSVCFLLTYLMKLRGQGKFFVGLKDSAFEPSSPTRHSAELYHLLLSRSLDSKPVLFLYWDDGPDHRLAYLSV